MTQPPAMPLKGWRAAAAVSGIAALVFLTTRTQTTCQPLGQTAPNFRLPDLSGQVVSLSNFSGQVVLVNFWATWCAPCQEELPDLIALHQKYIARGFTVLGVNLDVRGKKVVDPFIKENKIPFPILLTGGDVPKGYDVPGLPASALVDRKGRVVRSYLGPHSLKDLSRDVEQALGP